MTTSNQDWFNELQFTKYLGHGSFGYVFKSVSNSLQNSAVKLIFPSYSKDLKTKEKEHKKVLREFNNTVGKQHLNIVRTLKVTEKLFLPKDFEKLNNIPDLEENFTDEIVKYAARAKRLNGLNAVCIQMELCGATLRQWLGKEMKYCDDLCVTQASIVQGLVNGMSYLHSHKIIHRDLKPENIYFSSEYTLPVKIGDFGLSRELHLTKSERLLSSDLTPEIGTPGYRAPEVETHEYRFQADLFSLGLIIWEVLQLIQPFQRKKMFHALVYDNKKALIDDHKVILNARSVIVALTKRNTTERVDSLEKITLELDMVNSGVRVKQNVNQQQDVANAENKLKNALATPHDSISLAPKNKKAKGQAIDFFEAQPEILHSSTESLIQTKQILSPSEILKRKQRNSENNLPTNNEQKDILKALHARKYSIVKFIHSISPLNHEEIIRKKTFTRWINALLKKDEITVIDIFKVLSDGYFLYDLLQIISGNDLPPCIRGMMRAHKIARINQLLDYLRNWAQIQLKSIRTADIVDGRKIVILDLIWAIIQRYQIKHGEIDTQYSANDTSSSTQSKEQEMLAWCKTTIYRCASVEIENFTTSWASGRAFNALLDAYRPDLVHYWVLSPDNSRYNLNRAFGIAETHFKVPKLLDAEDFEYSPLDGKSVLLYVSMLRKALENATSKSKP